MAYSPYSERAMAFVALHPGCTKWALASYLTRNPHRSPSKQYYLVDTQIRLGNLRADWRGNRYALYVNRENE
jgi:hypothetical protein